MKPEYPNDPELSALMQTWKVDATLSPSFATRVRQQIASSSQPRPSLMGFIEEWILSRFPQPRVALAAAMGLVLLGGASGYWHGRTQSQAQDQALRVRYLQVVNPLQYGHPG